MLWLVRALCSTLFPPGGPSSSCTCLFGEILLSASRLMLVAWAEAGPGFLSQRRNWAMAMLSESQQGKLLFTGFQDAALLGLKSMFFLYRSQYFCLRGSILSPCLAFPLVPALGEGWEELGTLCSSQGGMLGRGWGRGRSRQELRQRVLERGWGVGSSAGVS